MGGRGLVGRQRSGRGQRTGRGVEGSGRRAKGSGRGAEGSGRGAEGSGRGCRGLVGDAEDW